MSEKSGGLGENGRTPESLEVEQFQPMRMLLPGHEFGGTFVYALGVLASCEGVVIQEETRAAVLDYGARWAIEPRFADFKGRVFELEDSILERTAWSG